MSPITNLINDPYFIHVFQWEIAVVCDGNIEFWIKMKLGFFFIFHRSFLQSFCSNLQVVSGEYFFQYFQVNQIQLKFAM